MTEVGRVRMPVGVRFLAEFAGVVEKRYGKQCRMAHEGDWLVFYAPEGKAETGPKP